MDLGLRRLILVVVSILGGIAGVFVLFFLLNITYNARVDVERYGYEYFALTALPLALLIGLWLDYFMRTGIIPENDGPPAAEGKRERPARGSGPAPAAEE